MAASSEAGILNWEPVFWYRGPREPLILGPGFGAEYEYVLSSQWSQRDETNAPAHMQTIAMVVYGALVYWVPFSL